MSRDLIFTILGIDKGSPAFDKVADAADKAEKRLGSFSSFGVKALAAMPAAALAGGVATAGALGVMATAVVGVSAVLLRSNQDVNDSYSDLGVGIAQVSEDAAQVMKGDLVQGANQMRAAFQDLTPEVYKLFQAADQSDAIEHLAGGISGLAKNAMPGFTTAVKNSEPALEGFESFLKDTGQGVTEFFTNVSKGSESSGQIMQSTGRIVRDFSGFTGALFAQLSNSGSPAVAALERFLRQLEGTVLSLGAGAFPTLSSSASGFLSAGSGVLRLLQLMAPVLGPLTGQVLTFATTLKLVDMVSFGGVTAGIGLVKTAMSEADGAGGKLKAGFGALAAGPLPILGIAAIGLTMLLESLGKKEREAAEAAKYHDQIVRGLIGTLDAQSGAITDDTRKKIANSVATEKVGKSDITLATAAVRLGMSQSDVVDAIANSDNAMKRMDATLRMTTENQIRASVSADDLRAMQDSLGVSVEDLVTIFMGGAGGVDEFQRKLQDFDAALAQNDDHVSTRLSGLGASMQSATSTTRGLWGGITELNSGLTDAQKQALQTAEGIGRMTPAQLEAKAKADALKTSFGILKDAFKSVAEKGQAVIDVLDRMSGKEPDLRASTQAWNDLMRTMTKDTDWNSTVDGVQKLGKGLVDMRGEVNTTTEAGSKLQDFAKQSALDFANQAAAMKAAGVPADEMSKKLDVMRQQFIDTAVAQGLPRDAAIRLADAYHLVPGQVSTLVLTPNLAQKMQEMGVFAQTVRTLPNGYVVVTADTNAAQHNVTKFIQDNTGKVITIRVTAIGTNREVVRNSAGGLPAAAAGMENSPGGWTLVGEKGPEIVDLPQGSDVYDAAETSRMLSRQQTSPGGLSSPTRAEAAPVVHKHFHLTTYVQPTTDITDQFRRMEMLAGV